MTAGKRLLMNPYSAKQFKEGAFTVTEAPQRDAEKEDFILIENLPVVLDGVDEAILFLWNERYPADVCFDMKALAAAGFARTASEDFAGYSHEKITVEFYRR